MAKTIKIAAYANNDDAMVVWKYNYKIKDCWGFSVFRKRKGETDAEAEPLTTNVGFAGDAHAEGETHPSTEWPIQKYSWVDYLVKTGDEVCYRVVPMISKNGTLKKSSDDTSKWSNWVKVGDPAGVEAYFNRGLVSSQAVARRLHNIPVKERKKALLKNLDDVKSSIRDFMGGNLLQALNNLLDEVKQNNKLQLYAALYELNEKDLIKRLNSIGKRAHIILANGAFGEDDNDPQKENADKLTKVDLTRRIVKSGHFAHNKFLVVTDKSSGTEVPVKVLTGSTNWTTNGVFTQINNAIVLHEADVVKYYKEEWEKIKADCDANGNGLYAAPFKKFNSTAKQSSIAKIKTYFTPVPKKIDLDEADALINGAKKGVIFLMFKPGTEKSRTLYKTIQALAKARPDLLVHGVINADPGGKKNPTIDFMNKNKVEPGDLDIVLPAGIDETFQFWMEEVGKQNVTIHSKVIVIDPFGTKPVVITGSHNMGQKASSANDDNMNIIEGNAALAQAYAIHMLAVYHHYRWRFYRSKKTGTPKWEGNVKSGEWQDWYKSGDKKKELDFWIQ